MTEIDLHLPRFEKLSEYDQRIVVDILEIAHLSLAQDLEVGQRRDRALQS